MQHKKYNPTLLLIAVVLVIKISLFVWAAYHFNFAGQPSETWISIWDRLDSDVYKTIARTAYTFPQTIKLDYWAFLSHYTPLYPLSMAIVSRIAGISLEAAGVLVSLVSGIGASILFYKLTYLEFKNEHMAWAAVIFLNLYPTSYFTISVYSESLFLLFTIGSFYYLKKENYLGAGLTAAGALLTRIVGVVFLPVYALYFLYRYKKEGFILEAIHPFLFSVYGLAAHLLINKIYFGSYLYLFTEKLSYNNAKYLIFPFQETVVDLIGIFKSTNFWNQDFMMLHGWNAVFTLLALIITVAGIKKLPWIYTAYSFGALLIIASLAAGISNARYTLSIFPLFMTLALIKNKALLLEAFIVSIFLLFYFARIFTSGAWAF